MSYQQAAELIVALKSIASSLAIIGFALWFMLLFKNMGRKN